jgi:tetratricopeptide (TPR) repeat protein
MFLSAALLFLQVSSPGDEARRTEEWARSLVATPHYATDDVDARIAEWCELVRATPSHPLTDLAIGMIARSAPDRPRDIAGKILTLDQRSVHPLAFEDLAALKLRTTLEGLPHKDVPKTPIPDLHPDAAPRALVLGPLAGSAFDADLGAACIAPETALSLPRSQALRAIGWLPVQRNISTAELDFESACAADSGWALVLLPFEHEGGVGWFELDFSGASAPGWISVRSAEGEGLDGASAFDGCRVAFDDGSVQELDFLSAERSLVWRSARSWRKGVNRVCVALPIGAGFDFSARLRDLSGTVQLWRTPEHPLGELGAGQAGAAAAESLIGALEHLEATEPRGPYAEALLGFAKFRDGRMTEGLAHVELALQMAPESVELMTFAAELYNMRSSLPETWRRTRARELVEAALAVAPSHVRAQVAMARILAPEDREEDALRGLEALESDARSVTPVLEQANLLTKLELEVRAEARLREALEQEPQSPRVLEALADRQSSYGLTFLARDTHEAQLRSKFDLSSLSSYADAQARLGERIAAFEARRTLARLQGGPGSRAALAASLVELGSLDEADSLWAELVADYPQQTYFLLRRADVAHRRRDRDGEIALLERVLSLEPSQREARSRLHGLGATDPAMATFTRFAVSAKEALEGFDASRWNDHIVRALDVAVVHVFEDGAFEQWTLERDVARDLEGCEQLGKQQPSGDMLSISTVKQKDGKSYEPVLVDGEYVMPALEPGDAVESSSRGFSGVPSDGLGSTTQWYFASTDAPYFLSRFVVSLPKSLDMQLTERNFRGEHEVLDEGERVVHIFTARNVDRVIPEPGAPPQAWYLPWVVFSKAQDLERIERELVDDLRVATRLTPQLIETAALACEGTETEEQRARALHAFVSQALDQRAATSRVSALSALLTRNGNPALLYSALLTAVGIENELIWSRGVEPAADPAPERELAGASRWTRELFVLVKPEGAEPAWCDLARKTLPYGKMLASAPGAEAFSVTRRAWTTLPEVTPTERPGETTTVAVRVGAERAAEVEVALEFTGNMGFAIKEQLREVPKAQMKRTVTGIASRIVPGISLAEYALDGLDGDDAPVSVRAKGVHKTLFDSKGGEFTCRLPFTQLDLSRSVASEGERKLPFLLQRASVSRTRVRFELPDGRVLASEHPEVVLEFAGGRYRLAFEEVSPAGFTVVRELYLPAGVIAAADFPAFVAFARSVDEAERVRIRLR